MENRIAQLTVQSTVAKTTSTEPFGAVLSRAVGTAANLVGNTVGGAFPVLSAALSGASRMGSGLTSLGGSSPAPAVNVGGSSGPSPMTGAGGGSSSPSGSGTGATGTGGSNDLLAAQQALQEQGQSFNMQYLQLQNSMQQESQQFTAVSNIMKVRSDSAKAAINNIR
jgi:hypothetical protein